jgi:hypothetical protein
MHSSSDSCEQRPETWLKGILEKGKMRAILPSVSDFSDGKGVSLSKSME